MATSIDKKSIQLMIDRYQRELDELFEEQEAVRQRKANKSSLKAWSGMEVPWSTISSIQQLKNRRPIEGVDVSQLGQTNPYLQATRAANDTSLSGTNNPYDPTQPKSGGGFLDQDWGGYLDNIATISPILYNTYMGLQKPRTLNAKDFYNPYANQVASLMHNRRVNVQPQLDAALDAQRIANYNASRVGAGNMGNIQGNFAAIANNAMRTRAGIMANKQNTDLGYMGEEAQTINNRGLHESGMDLNIADYNERSRASKRNYLGTATSQLSNLSQVNKQMSNQVERDKLLNSLYKDIYSVSQYMPALDDINRYLEQFKKRI